MATQAERSAATTAAVLASATELFAAQGWASTSMEEVARAAGVTKGGLYHHYKDKTELLAAVYEDLERRNVEQLLQRGGDLATDPLAALRDGSRHFLEQCLDPVCRAISLVEAPAGLGWERWRAIDAQHGFGLMRMAVQAAVDAGQLRPLPVDQISHQLLAALLEAALLVGQADDPAAEIDGAAATFDALLDGLRP